MWDLDDSRLGRVFSHGTRRRRVVHHHCSRLHGDPLEHGKSEIAEVGARSGTSSPKFFSQPTVRTAVVVDELVDVVSLVELPEKKMMQKGVVQHHDAGSLQSAAIDLGMERVVA